MKKKVDELIEFATKQTFIDYECAKGANSTATVVSLMQAGKYDKKEWSTKESTTSTGYCYTWVKIALVRMQIVTETPAGANASEAGDQLKKAKGFGFTDVTDELPDARWAAAGDIITYYWSDLTYKGRKRKKPKRENEGHIDIRSEGHYISDYITKHPKWVVDSGALSLTKKGESIEYSPNYVKIKIFRKYFNPLPTCRIRAFLRCIRELECTSTSDDAKRYKRLNKALPTNPGEMYFESLDEHPWSKIPAAQRPTKAEASKGHSSAAGAYQILIDTWENRFLKGYFPDLKKPSFSAQIQDRIAVMLLEDADVLHLIRAGKIEEALDMKGLRGQWSSFPGGEHNNGRTYGSGKSARPIDRTLVLELFEKFFNEEKKKEGL